MTALGFIGLGNIGLPMAIRLQGTGHPVVGFDLDAERIGGLTAAGGRAASSVRDVADQCETVFMSLPGPDSAMAVVCGPDGVRMGAAVKRVVDLSTIGSPTARILSSALREEGVAYVDSPVSGGPAPAARGALTIMTACPPDDQEAVRAPLEALGRVYHVGEQAGMGQMMKLVNNVLSATAMAISCEAVNLGIKAGLDAKVIVDIASSGTGRNSALQDKFPASILPRTFDWGFTTGMMCKDLALAMKEADAIGMPMLVATAVRQLWQVANNEMGANSDITMMMLMLEDWSERRA